MASMNSVCILALAFISAANARRAPLNHDKRQINPVPVAVPASTTSRLPLTTIFPSPEASPVVVTVQSQIVSTYIPQFTLCELPPLAFFTPSALATPTSGSLPFLNYSISTPTGNGTCTTIYKPTITAVCATVLSDLTTTYTISQCNQNITFSTEYGYSLVIPTPTPVIPSGSVSLNSTSYITPPPSIQTMRTYYIAPWQDLTSAGPPADVDYKICKEYENGTEACILEYYRWRTTLLTLSSLTTTLINLTTTIPGPSQLIIETLVANVTGTAITFSMSTTMELETSTLFESTVVKPKYQLTAPTVYQTKTVEYASQLTTTITSHVKLTLTTTVGTATITLTRSTVTPVASVVPISTPAVESPVAPVVPTSIPAVDTPVAPVVPTPTPGLESPVTPVVPTSIPAVDSPVAPVVPTSTPALNAPVAPVVQASTPAPEASVALEASAALEASVALVASVAPVLSTSTLALEAPVSSVVPTLTPALALDTMAMNTDDVPTATITDDIPTATIPPNVDVVPLSEMPSGN